MTARGNVTTAPAWSFAELPVSASATPGTRLQTHYGSVQTKTFTFTSSSIQSPAVPGSLPHGHVGLVQQPQTFTYAPHGVGLASSAGHPPHGQAGSVQAVSPLGKYS
jgi:hypothetical protein